MIFRRSERLLSPAQQVPKSVDRFFDPFFCHSVPKVVVSKIGGLYRFAVLSLMTLGGVKDGRKTIVLSQFETQRDAE